MITGPSGPTLEQLFGAPEAAAPVEAEAPPEAVVDPLPDSVIDTLAAAGYAGAEDIAAAPDEELLALPGIGPATLDHIRAAIG